MTTARAREFWICLEPGDLRLGQVVIKRAAVVKHGVNNVRAISHRFRQTEINYYTFKQAAKKKNTRTLLSTTQSTSKARLIIHS